MKSESQEVAVSIQEKMVQWVFQRIFRTAYFQDILSQSSPAGDKTFTSFESEIITKLAWGAGWFWMKGHSV